jgi:exonuclease SbcC
MLSASAERLLTLARTRSEVQVFLERLDREIEAIGARKLDEEALAELDRQLAGMEAMFNELRTLMEALTRRRAIAFMRQLQEASERVRLQVCALAVHHDVEAGLV